MMPPFLTWSLSMAKAAVVRERNLFEADLLKHFAHRVAHGRGRSEGKVDDAERHAKTAGSLLSHKLTHARDLERGALDGLAQELEVLAFGRIRVRGRPHRGRRHQR